MRSATRLPVLFGVVDVDRQVLVYASAGHEAVVLLGDSGEARLLVSTGPMVGVGEEVRLFEQKVVKLSSNDTIVAFTDGVTEARSDTGDSRPGGRRPAPV